ncbi:hypothetical protein V5799_005906 [Amblyomma americanum]|uniref:Nlr family card domain protein n=1 Tax=Amblyomma americanum TaxID=6943 RepID=A0AAQ4DXX4_AMBAM
MTTVRIRARTGNPTAADWPVAEVLRATWIQELYLSSVDLIGAAAEAEFATFLGRADGLVKLSLAHFVKRTEDPALLFRALQMRPSIVDLCIDVTCLQSDHAALLAQYLRNSVQLKFLHLKGASKQPRVKVSAFVDAVRYLERLENLQFTSFSMDMEDTVSTAKAIVANQTLEEFQLNSCPWQLPAETEPSDVLAPDVDAPWRIAPLVMIIKSSASLKYFGVNLDPFTGDEVMSFFRCIVHSAIIQEVTVLHSDESVTGALCQAVVEAGAEKRVRLSGAFVNEQGLHLARTLDLLETTFCADQAAEPGVLLSSLTQLPSWRHLTQVVFTLPAGVSRDEASLIGQCLRSCRNLAFITMEFETDQTSERIILEGLAANKSVTSLAISKEILSRRNAGLLSAFVQSSRSLYAFKLNSASETTIRLVTASLADGIEGNRTLRLAYIPKSRAQMRAWLKVQRVAARNDFLVSLAASFVRSYGMQEDVFGLNYKAEAMALDLVAPSESLLILLATSTRKPKELLRQWSLHAWLHIHELNEFMRLTGVVKEAVTCHQRPDCSKPQIDTLPRDCWLRISYFLKVGDVANGDH